MLCYALLLELGLNFLRSMVSTSWRDLGLWDHSESAAAAAQLASAAVHRLAAAHDEYLTAQDPRLTLKVRRLSFIGSRITDIRLF